MMRGMGLLLLLQLAWITATYAAPWSHFLDWFRSNSEQWTILFPKMTFLRPSQEALQVNLIIFKEKPMTIQDIFENSTDLLATSHAHGFKVKHRQGIVGKGYEDYKRVSQSILSLTLTNKLAWAFISKLVPLPRKGDTICTVTRFYRTPIWSLNPCRITELVNSRRIERKDEHDTFVDYDGQCLVTKIAYQTVQGHMLSGRESMAVRLLGNQSVVLELVSISRGFALTGRLLGPLIGPLQDRFLKDHFHFD